MIKKFIKKYQYELFSVFFTIVIVGSLFSPGYIILLDWPIGPLVHLYYSDMTSIIGLPFNFIFYILSLYVPTWILQKALIFILFFIGFYAPIKLLENLEEEIDLYIEHKFLLYFVSLFNVINPFVYERFLAGQWRVVAGYFSLLPLIIVLIGFYRDSNIKNAVRIFLILFVVGIFSIHFFVIDLIFLCLFILVKFGVSVWRTFVLKYKNCFGWSVKILFSSSVFIVFSFYWIIPYIYSDNVYDIVSNFDSTHQRAFEVAHRELSVLENIISMHGFWLESHIWSDNYSLSKHHALFWVVFFIIILLALLGFIFLIRSKMHFEVFFLSLIFVVSLVFASGPYNNIFGQINIWLLDNLSFWGGFRDSQKWVGGIVIFYILMSVKGLDFLISMLDERYKFSHIKFSIIKILMIIIPVFLVPQMLFGFGSQIDVSNYPYEWSVVNNYLKKQDNCVALFLPWHQYYETGFNKNGLSYNLSKNYFNCDIVLGHNTELMYIEPIWGNSFGNIDYETIDEIMLSNNDTTSGVDDAIDILLSNDIKYIIFDLSFIDRDFYKYPFLRSSRVRKIINLSNIVLYEIKG